MSLPESPAEPPSLDPPPSSQEGTLPRPTKPGLLARASLLVIRAYQATAPFRPPMCRFHPSCSEYTRQAIEKYGLIKGGWLGTKRICRCHPFYPGGNDPVP